MSILTKSGTSTFGAASNFNVRINWTESFDTSSINSSYPYGRSTITITSIQFYSYNHSHPWQSCAPFFLLKFNNIELQDFNTQYYKYAFSCPSTNTWHTLKNLSSSGQFTGDFTYSFSYTRESINENAYFYLNPPKGSPWQYPGATTVLSSNPTYQWIGGGSASWGAVASLITTYTNPTAPVSVYITQTPTCGKTGTYWYRAYSGIAAINWSSGTSGTNNSIGKYEIYASINGGSYTKIAETASQSYNFNSIYSRGTYITFKIIACGQYSNSPMSSATSERLYINRLPYIPTGYDVYVANSSSATGVLSYSAGSDPDGQPVTTYYSTSNNPSGALVYDGRALGVGTYYLFSYDGLEFSSASSARILKASGHPAVASIDYSVTEFTPYAKVEGYDCKYASTIQIKGLSLSPLSDRSYNGFEYAVWWSEKIEDVKNFSGNSYNTIFNTSNTAPTSSNSISLDVYYEVPHADFFRIGVRAKTTLGEVSNWYYSPQIFASGGVFSALDFDFSVNTCIDNSGNEFTNSVLENYFDKYIKFTVITPKNPTTTISNSSSTLVNKPYYSIDSISLGSVSGTSYSGKLSLQGSILPEKTFNTLVNFSNYDRGVSVNPGIKVSQYIHYTVKKLTASKTRIKLLQMSSINVSPPSFKFFKDPDDTTTQSTDLLNGATINFTGSKIIGEDNINVVKNVTLQTDLTNGSAFGMIYSDDGSSTPTKITFKSLYNFKLALENKGYDNIKDIIYNLSIYDYYGNILTKRVTQTIDFRIAPYWKSTDTLTTKVEYKINSSTTEKIVNSSTDLSYRILNPGDKIKISWNAAEDYGNGNSAGVTYKISSYKKTLSTSTTGDIPLSFTNLFFSTTTSNTEYVYTIPYNTTVDAISFEIQALDQSGMISSKILRTSSSQKLAIGRAEAPTFDIINYIATPNSSGTKSILSGVLKILDYGDSRIFYNLWNNYERLETTNPLLLKIDDKIVIYTLSADNSQGSFNNVDNNYPTSGKISFRVSLSPRGLNLQSLKTFIYSFDGPTFSYRNHQIGINIKADTKKDSVLSIGSNGTGIDKKTKVYFIVTKPNWDDIQIDLSKSSIYNIIIDGGSW